MSQRINLLEHSLMELGTEMYKLKSEVKSMTDFNQKLIKIVSGLKAILDEKGLISADDFDSAVELGDAINLTGGAHTTESKDVKLKKSVH